MTSPNSEIVSGLAAALVKAVDVKTGRAVELQRKPAFCVEQFSDTESDRVRYAPLGPDGMCGHPATHVVRCSFDETFGPKCSRCVRFYNPKCVDIKPMTPELNDRIAALQRGEPDPAIIVVDRNTDWEREIAEGVCSFCREPVVKDDAFLCFFKEKNGRLYRPQHIVEGESRIAVLTHANCGPDTYWFPLDRIATDCRKEYGLLFHIGTKRWACWEYEHALELAEVVAKKMYGKRKSK